MTNERRRPKANKAPSGNPTKTGVNYDRDYRFVFTGQIRGLVDDNGKPITK